MQLTMKGKPSLKPKKSFPEFLPIGNYPLLEKDIMVICSDYFHKVHRTRKKLGDGSSLEVYSTNRYFTVTGKSISQVNEISRNQDCLDWLINHYELEPEKKSDSSTRGLRQKESFSFDSKELIQKIRDSKKGWKFNQLFGGDWQEYPSQSEADQSLCSILAFWTGNDPIQIDDIFRQSGLFRKK